MKFYSIYVGFIILLMMFLSSLGDAPQKYQRFNNVNNYEYLRL